MSDSDLRTSIENKTRTIESRNLAIVMALGLLCATVVFVTGFYLVQTTWVTRTCLEQNHSPQDCGHP